MSTDSAGSVSSEDADNTVFWTDMDTVLREKEQDALQDNLYAEQESQREAEQYQQIMNNILEPSANGSGVLDILDTNPTLVERELNDPLLNEDIALYASPKSAAQLIHKDTNPQSMSFSQRLMMERWKNNQPSTSIYDR